MMKYIVFIWLLLTRSVCGQSPPRPPNDSCFNAIDVNPFSRNVFTGDTRSASLDINPGTCGVQTTAPGIWYKVANRFQRNLTITASTCNNGTNYDTQILVLKGFSCTSFTACTARNDQNCGSDASKVQFVAEVNATYYILVHGWAGAVGQYALTIDTTDAFPMEYFTLIDSKTDKAIGVLDSFSYGSVNSTSFNLNIEAVYARNSSIQSVLVTFDDPPISVCENEAPYSVFRDTNGAFA